MRLALVALVVIVALGGFVALPEGAPAAVVEPADACAPVSGCLGQDPICWGPHERPTCI